MYTQTMVDARSGTMRQSRDRKGLKIASLPLAITKKADKPFYEMCLPGIRSRYDDYATILRRELSTTSGHGEVRVAANFSISLLFKSEVRQYVTPSSTHSTELKPWRFPR